MPSNMIVDTKRREIGPFKFSKIIPEIKLKLVKGVKEGNETYYGFM